ADQGACSSSGACAEIKDVPIMWSWGFPTGKRGEIEARSFLTQSHELVADSRGRQNKLGLSGIVFHFLTQAGHVRINCTGEHTGLIAPQRPQQFGSRDSSSRAFYQVTKKLKLTAGKIKRLSV